MVVFIVRGGNAIAPGFLVSNQNRALLFQEDGTPTPRSNKILAGLPDCPVDVSEGNPAVLIVSKHTMIRNLPFFEPNAERKSGCILNVSSMNAYVPLTKIPAYSGAKAAVSNFTQWLATHFAGTGILRQMQNSIRRNKLNILHQWEALLQ